MPIPLPTEPLRKILVEAFRPCVNFASACAGRARWIPEEGHVPRGFIGAFAATSDVELVVVTAEPADPGERYQFDEITEPDARLAAVCRSTYEHFVERRGQYHANMCFILDLIWPDMSLDEQLKRT